MQNHKLSEYELNALNYIYDNKYSEEELQKMWKGEKDMLRLTQKARGSAIKEIDRLIEVVNHIPGNHLSFIDASSITKFLSEYKNEIKKEYKANDWEV